MALIHTRMGFSLHPNVTVRAKKAKLHSSLIEYPWDHCNQEERFDQNFDYHVANYQFSQGDYDSLSGSSWLTDRLIDCFMALALSSDFLSNSEASLLVLDSMVLECATMGLQSVFERAIRSKFIFNDVWIVPTHVQRNHWILIRTKKVIIVDPLGGRVSDSVEEHIQIVRHMLSLSHSDIFKNEIAWNEWEFTAPSDMGSQSNSYDCGVCVCVWTYFISTGLTPPSVQEICASSTAVRTWMKNLPLSKAVKTERLKPQKFKAEDEHIVAVYSDFDKGVSSGSVKIEKPWLSLPAHVVSRDLVGGSRTVDFLATIMRNLWEATDTFCGAERCKRGILAYFCEGCREFFHLGCIGDLRKPPEQGDYMCPKHIIVETRTREACSPVRFRRSLE
ncbi:Sentrin-specific protease [Frankliniella fusca]|uniref:Sentrin-specific protease n=1 Tax=Frankliniella fusca TaxID=407009 RepID=A0AAE1LJQ9_9NEOP|nr:Sentrin-specific protease [Frankliniella fusca]